MKVSLAENLRALMVKHLFEKITIKQICDETGVNRATFYNYFEDKYDCLQWIVYHAESFRRTGLSDV
jgi:Transcriptional regulator